MAATQSGGWGASRVEPRGGKTQTLQRGSSSKCGARRDQAPRERQPETPVINVCLKISPAALRIRQTPTKGHSLSVLQRWVCRLSWHQSLSGRSDSSLTHLPQLLRDPCVLHVMRADIRASSSALTEAAAVFIRAHDTDAIQYERDITAALRLPIFRQHILKLPAVL
jgi:hypothetical protein